MEQERNSQKRKQQKSRRQHVQPKETNGRGLPDLPRMTYGKLLRRLSDNPADAYTIAVKKVLRGFYRGHEEDADDAFHHLLLKLCEEEPNERIPGPPSAWLYTVLRNDFCDRYRRNQTVQDHREKLGRRAEAAHRRRGAVDDPAEQASRNEQNALIQAALDELPDHERELFSLHYEYDCTYEKLAAEYSTTCGAMRSKLHRIMTRLRHSESLRRYRDAVV